MASHSISFFLLGNWVNNMIYNNLQKAQELWSEYYYLRLLDPTSSLGSSCPQSIWHHLFPLFPRSLCLQLPKPS